MAFGSFDQGGGGAGPAPMSEINTTPLVDVMLVLLIIFIVCAPLMTQTITVNLPKAVGEATDVKPEIISLAVDAEGNITWNEQKMSREEVAAKMKEEGVKDPQPELHLIADKDARYENVAQVMGIAREAGMKKMGFVTIAGGAMAAGGAAAAPAASAPAAAPAAP